MDPLTTASDAILRAGRRLGSRGLISAGEGNISVRLDADRLLVTPDRRAQGRARTPTTSSSSGSVTPIARHGLATGRRPTSDLAIHLAVHAARPDIGAMVHAHLPGGDGLTLAGEVPDPAALPETALFLPRLPFLTLGDAGQSSGWPSGSRPRSPIRPSRSRPRSCSSATARARSGATRPTRSTVSSSSRCSAGRGAMRCSIRAARATLAMVDESATQPRAELRGGTMNARKYLAELLGTFMFMMIGYMSVPGVPRRRTAGAEPAGRAVLVRVRPAGRDLRVRAHLRRPLQPGRHGRDDARRARTRRSRASATSSPRSSAPSLRPSSSC